VRAFTAHTVAAHTVMTIVMAIALTFAGAAWSYQLAVNFQLQCMGCHRADGSGQPGRVPSMRNSLLLFSATADGRNYVIRVPGVAQSPLSDADTAALLNWMARNLSDHALPSGFTDYTAAEVASLRHRPLAKVSEIRTRLLRAAGAKAPLP
jgi:mono/diheme cytochrome c family protein